MSGLKLTDFQRLIINVEGNFDQLVAQVGNAMGTVWNSWQTQWSGTSVSRQQISSRNRRHKVVVKF